ncbi:nose resistant to fluoxetine protein 6-like [Diprion similis]|uniref:nose resistant to fluoxetine protein 6-like n=1 Tax=Diprion similis TaxID=362088 RepID=UPI001EF80CA5|nr:nose resistant to fluoxetine protein 6-like [Diprion similis]
MLSFRAGCAAVLLFAWTQSLASASLEADGNKTIEFIKQFATTLKTQWMEKIPSIENSFNTSCTDVFSALISGLQFRDIWAKWMEKIPSIVNSSDTSCTDEFSALISGLQSRDTWAMKMLDATSKIQSGIMTGNVRELGMYDECFEASGKHDNVTVQGKFCSLIIRPRSHVTEAMKGDLQLGMTSSVCVPSSCNELQIEELVSLVSENLIFEVEIDGVRCVESTSEDFTTGEILLIQIKIFSRTLFAAIVQFMIFSTICDFLRRRGLATSSTLIETLSKFSLYTNALAVLSTEVKPQMMPSIQGIRVLATCWILLGHRYAATLFNPTVNVTDIFAWMDSWPSTYIQVAVFAVDTFFVIGGFVLAYTFLNSMKSGKKFNLPMMYLHRYLRLTPSLLAIVLFTAVLLHRVANGPMWDMMYTLIITPCRQSWWYNIFYIQNLADKEHICLLHSWYLAVDMQLFWISPVILYPLYRWPKVGLGILGSLLVISIVTPAVVLGVNRYSNEVFQFNESIISMEHFYNYYIQTYNRACAYFVGILLGYDVVTKKRQLTKVNVSICWAISCIFILVCGCATHFTYNSNFPYNLTREVVFAFIMRPFWSIAMAWLVYACTQGYGGPVSHFLSWPIFLPLSRLSYNMYLVSFVIQMVKVFSTRVPSIFTDIRVINESFSDIALSVVFAFIVSIFIESPVIVLEKMLTKKSQKLEKATTLTEIPENNGKAKEDVIQTTAGSQC